MVKTIELNRPDLFGRCDSFIEVQLSDLQKLIQPITDSLKHPAELKTIAAQVRARHGRTNIDSIGATR